MGKSFRSAPAVRGAPGLAAAGALALAALLPTVAPAGERETAGGAEFDSPDIELSGPEVYKLDHATHSLRAADVDDDGRTDLLLVNNSKARIEVLLQNTPERMREDAAKAERDPDDPNRLGDPFRFRREPFLTEKGVTSFVVADVTGDGRPDLVYFGDRELCVAPGEKSGKFAKARTFRVQDGSPARDALAIGDVNGDGRADIVLLGERSTYIFHQDGKGGISDPVAMANVSREIQGIFLADATGDGRADLFLLAPSAERCLLMREQKPGGGFSADVGFNVGKYRALAQARLSAGAKASGILAIHQVTGMVKAMALGIAPDGKEGKGANAGKPRFGRIRFHPLLESKEGGDRSFVMADIGGRGALDVLATDPGGARIALYRRGKGERGGFGAPQYYPMPTGISDICAGDFNGDGRIEIAVCSPKESSIGIAGEEASGRVSYPKPVPGVKGKPFAAAAADFNGDGKTDLAYAAADASSHLVGVMIQKDGAFVPGPHVQISGMRMDPDGLLALDADGDGRMDMALLSKRDHMRILLQDRDGGFSDLSKDENYGRGIVKDIARGSFGLFVPAGGKAPYMLAASANFARAIVLKDGRRLEILDQFNASDPQADVIGCAMADLDGDGTPEVLLVDKRAKKLLVLSRGPQGAYRQVDEHDIGDFQFRGIEVADADGDGNPDAVLYGQDRFGILYGGAKDPEWDEAGFYESDARDAHLVLVTAGSFFGGATHAVVVDARNNTVEILSLAPKAGGEGIAIRRSARFKVFEAKSFRGRREAPTENEPREAAIADVTGDGKTDLILLCHDRLLVYPRE